MAEEVHQAPKDPSVTAWSPLRSRVFLVVWSAGLVSAIGTWIADVGAGWLMTSLTSSAAQVALIQVATTLPVFLLSLPAGAMADILDRRKVLLCTSLILAAVSIFIGVMTSRGAMTPNLLIASLAVGGVCTALAQPMQQSLTPLLVERAHLRSAIALNSLGFNIARAIGPAIAGAIIAASSVAINFFVDAFSNVAVLLAFLWWKGASRPATDYAAESLLPAMRAGVRYAMHSEPLKRTLLRAISFFVYASALWALLPILARRELGGGPGYYGVLLSCIGTGAVAGAILLPKVRNKVGTEGAMRAGMAAAVAALTTLALTRDQIVAAVAMTVAGAAWISVLTTANVSAQTALPDWVRGRGLAMYLMAFYGSMAVGSLIWGHVADWAGVPAALLAAAVVGAVSLALAFVKPLPVRELDLTPSLHWPEPAISPAMQANLDADRGPVLITIEYLVDGADAAAFLGALSAFKSERLRDGAFQWGVFEDADRPGRFVEQFMVASWVEHQRQHRRVSKTDAELQAKAVAYHRGASPPKVDHLIAARPPVRLERAVHSGYES